MVVVLMVYHVGKYTVRLMDGGDGLVQTPPNGPGLHEIPVAFPGFRGRS